jgi:F420-dependent oxidoreductase-like protein
MGRWRSTVAAAIRRVAREGAAHGIGQLGHRLGRFGTQMDGPVGEGRDSLQGQLERRVWRKCRRQTGRAALREVLRPQEGRKNGDVGMGEGGIGAQVAPVIPVGLFPGELLELGDGHDERRVGHLGTVSHSGMRLGTQISSFTWPDAPHSIGPTFSRIARDADGAGVSSLWVMDHFFQISMIGPPELDMLEGYTALAVAAGQTQRITLGTLVTGVTYRHPGLLIKTVTTLDVLSGGRAWLGIGAAWNEEEHVGLGVPYPSTSERFERLEETLQLAKQMWRGDDAAFTGRHYQLARPLNVPNAIARPHPPILIGGSGEKKTLRLVAQYADACNIFDMGPAAVSAKYDVLRGHCDAVGRDYATIEKTVLTRLSLGDGNPLPSGEPTVSVTEAVDRLGRLAEIGTDHVIAGMGNDFVPGTFDLVADLVRQVEPIVPAGR